VAIRKAHPHGLSTSRQAAAAVSERFTGTAERLPVVEAGGSVAAGASAPLAGAVAPVVVAAVLDGVTAMGAANALVVGGAPSPGAAVDADAAGAATAADIAVGAPIPMLVALAVALPLLASVVFARGGARAAAVMAGGVAAAADAVGTAAAAAAATASSRGQKSHARHLQRWQWARANLATQNGMHDAVAESPLKVEVHAPPSGRPGVMGAVAGLEAPDGGGGGGAAPAALLTLLLTLLLALLLALISALVVELCAMTLALSAAAPPSLTALVRAVELAFARAARMSAMLLLLPSVHPEQTMPASPSSMSLDDSGLTKSPMEGSGACTPKAAPSTYEPGGTLYWLGQPSKRALKNMFHMMSAQITIW